VLSLEIINNIFKGDSMQNSNDQSISSYFGKLSDPRRDNKRHKLIDIITIAICGVICNADSFEHIVEFGQAKYEWLKGFLELPHGIPSPDTFERVFSRLEPKQFKECFMQWVQAINQLTKGQVIAVDGKTLRRSHDRSNAKSAIHMISAWACANGLVLGQIKTEEKSNEITAIPELLKLLEIKETSLKKKSIKSKRLRAGWDNDYLLKVING
jgi:predicted transposase YbfD/YdcC